MFTKAKSLSLATPRPGVLPPEYEAVCGNCGAPLARRASFRIIQRDVIACASCEALNEVTPPLSPGSQTACRSKTEADHRAWRDKKC